MWAIAVLLGAVSGSDILFAAEVCRHGARAPNIIFDFQKEYWEEYEPGQLTALGMRQAFLTGVELRRRYVEEWGLMNSTYRPSEVYVQSTNKDRAIETAYSQLSGLFPARTGKRLPSGAHLLPPMPIRDAERTERELGDSALPYLMASIPVHVDDFDHVLHGYKEKICPRMEQIKDEMKLTEKYKDIEERAIRLMEDGGWGSEGKEVKGAKQLCSAIMCDIAQGNPLPPGIDLPTLQSLHRDIVVLPFLSPEAQILTCSEFFRRLLQHFSDRLANNPLRFALYSAHDYTLIAFLSCLGHDIPDVPPFASTLVFELFYDLSVSITYNGLPLESKACPSGLCPLADFQTYAQRFIVTDIVQACELQ